MNFLLKKQLERINSMQEPKGKLLISAELWHMNQIPFQSTKTQNHLYENSLSCKIYVDRCNSGEINHFYSLSFEEIIFSAKKDDIFLLYDLLCPITLRHILEK